jgi:hypothetical protein
MQKVVGSSPIIRFENPRKSGVLFWKKTTWVPDESQVWIRNVYPRVAHTAFLGRDPAYR